MNPDGTAIAQQDWITGVAVALAFAFLLLVVVLPGAVLTLLSIADVLLRVDIGRSKLVWAPLLMVPGLGLAMYWLARPTEYQPLLDTGGTSFSVTYMEPPPTYASAARPAAAMAPAAVEDEEEQELPKAA